MDDRKCTAMLRRGLSHAVVIGFLLMCVIYFLDYTVIAKYSRFIGGAILILGGLRVAGFGGVDINGVGNWYRIWNVPGVGYFPDDVLCTDLRRYPI